MFKTTWRYLLSIAASLACTLASAGTVYYHNDIAGSPIAATSETGAVLWRESYRPYGERLTNAPASEANDIWFTSRRQDVDTGLVYMGARYYDPVTGRFISKDPVGFDEANVHSFNRYAYANNNPYRYRDPDGTTTAPLYIAGGLAIGILLTPEDKRREMGEALVAGLRGLYNIFNEQDDSAAPKSGGGEKDPSTPTGRRGSPMDVRDGTNQEGEIGGREYSGHALDQMQGRGVPPSAVEGAIQHGEKSPGNKPGRTVHTAQDGLTVVTEGGRVITVINK
jgi:RHS repeat-associated protein